jgi:outer membrane protein assembly factor BamA
VGDTGFFTNVELRFPLVDVLATPFFAFQGIRGVVFFDLGGAWFRDFQSFDLLDEDNRLKDGVSSYGFGVTVGFLGLDLNWDFAKRWDFKDGEPGFATDFWIGTRF